MEKTVNFKSLKEATAEDMKKLMHGLWDYEETLPEKLLQLLDQLKDEHVYPVSRYEHSLQTATRAYRDGADDEMTMIALLHDIGEVFSVRNHAAVSAEILKPYITADNYWLLYNHQIFQGHYYFDKIGLDENLRDKFIGHPMFEKAVYFCKHWDQPSFEKNYDTMPLSFFEPIIKKVMKKNMERIVKFKFVEETAHRK
jgi:predicted HD phosphohydrolase